MADLYERRAAVTVGPPGGTGVRAEGPFTADGKQGFRISFSVEKTIQSETNKATIQLYNLSEQSRNKIRTKFDSVILEAGYLGITGVLYRGEITKVIHAKNGPDIVTTIEAGDGAFSYGEAQVNHTFGRGTRIVAMIDEVARQLGKQPKRKRPPRVEKLGEEPDPVVILGRLTFGGLASSLLSLEVKLVARGIKPLLVRSLAISSSVKDAMDDLAKRYYFDWSIQDGNVQIIPLYQLTNAEAVILSQLTGMIGVPERTDKGIRCRSLLNPKLTAGGAVVAFVTVNNGTQFQEFGTYRCDSLKFEGDTHSDTWTAEAEGAQIPGVL